jgi:hypothetical protein
MPMDIHFAKLSHLNLICRGFVLLRSNSFQNHHLGMQLRGKGLTQHAWHPEVEFQKQLKTIKTTKSTCSPIQYQGLTHVILTIWEVKIREMEVPGQSGQKERFYLQNNHSKKGWKCGSSKCEALNSNPSTAKEGRRDTGPLVVPA